MVNHLRSSVLFLHLFNAVWLGPTNKEVTDCRIDEEQEKLETEDYKDYFNNKVWLGPTNKEVTDCRIDEEQEKLETEHYKDYFNNKELYETWPELDQKSLKSTCLNYLKKLFPKKNLKSVNPLRHKIKVDYKNKNNLNGKILKLPSLECHIKRSKGLRNYFHFIRAPQFNCKYVMNRKTNTSHLFYISIKLCEHDTYTSLKNQGKLQQIHCKVGKYRTARDNDNEMKLIEHEQKHLEDYLLNQTVYTTWPELQDKGEEKYCQMLLPKIFPKMDITNIRFLHFTIKYFEVYYTRIIYGSNLSPVNVKALKCYIDTSPNHSSIVSQMFIRAPAVVPSNCVYVVKRNLMKKSHFHITKKLCEKRMDEDLNAKLEGGTFTTKKLTTNVVEYFDMKVENDMLTTKKLARWE